MLYQGSQTLYRTCVQQRLCLVKKNKKKKHTTWHYSLNTLSDWWWFFKQSCTYNLVKILPLLPTSTTVQYCVQLQAWHSDRKHTLTALLLVSSSLGQYFSLVSGACLDLAGTHTVRDSGLICLPSWVLLSTG